MFKSDHVHRPSAVNSSHAHTVVWECCKDDRQSQWGMTKFDPQPTLNPWTDRHQIWNTWLRRGYLLPKKFGLNPPRGFCPPTYVKYTPKTFGCLLLFKVLSEPPEMSPLDRLSRLIRHTTWFCARKCLLEWENLILKFNWFIRKIRKIYNGAYGEI